MVSMCVVICLLFVTLIPVSEAQSGLRRLFTTPALRAELDRRRLQELQGFTNVVEPIVVTPIDEELVESDASVPDTIYRVGGSMRRSDGNYTVWINDVAIAAADLPANMLLMQPYSQGQIRISNPETGANYIVKPGQVLNLTQGELMESYEYRTRSRTASAATRIQGAVGAEANDRIEASEPAADSAVNASPVTNTSAVELLEQAQRIRTVSQ